MNPYHYGKATRVCYGLDDLIATLKRDVQSFVDGWGYMSPDDPRIASMRKRYKANGWRWPSEEGTGITIALTGLDS